MSALQSILRNSAVRNLFVRKNILVSLLFYVENSLLLVHYHMYITIGSLPLVHYHMYITIGSSNIVSL